MVAEETLAALSDCYVGRKLSGLSGSKGSDQWLDAQRAEAEEKVHSMLGDEWWGPQCSASSSVTLMVTQNKPFAKALHLGMARHVQAGKQGPRGQCGSQADYEQSVFCLTLTNVYLDV